MKYAVNVKEIHIRTIIVECDSPETAKKQVSEYLENDEIPILYDCEMEYSHTTKPDDWLIYEYE